MSSDAGAGTLKTGFATTAGTISTQSNVRPGDFSSVGKHVVIVAEDVVLNTNTGLVSNSMTLEAYPDVEGGVCGKVAHRSRAYTGAWVFRRWK